MERREWGESVPLVVGLALLSVPLLGAPIGCAVHAGCAGDDPIDPDVRPQIGVYEDGGPIDTDGGVAPELPPFGMGTPAALPEILFRWRALYELDPAAADRVHVRASRGSFMLGAPSDTPSGRLPEGARRLTADEARQYRTVLEPQLVRVHRATELNLRDAPRNGTVVTRLPRGTLAVAAQGTVAGHTSSLAPSQWVFIAASQSLRGFAASNFLEPYREHDRCVLAPTELVQGVASPRARAELERDVIVARPPVSGGAFFLARAHATSEPRTVIQVYRLVEGCRAELVLAPNAPPGSEAFLTQASDGTALLVVQERGPPAAALEVWRAYVPGMTAAVWFEPLATGRAATADARVGVFDWAHQHPRAEPPRAIAIRGAGTVRLFQWNGTTLAEGP